MNKVNKNNILFNLEGNTVITVLEKMVSTLFKNRYINNQKVFLNDVMEREEEISTGIGNELAIPHGKSNSVTESTVSVAILKNGIDWEGGLDEQPVKYVFLLAIKEGESGEEHLRILADLSSKLMDEEYVNRIKNSNNREELNSVLKEIES